MFLVWVPTSSTRSRDRKFKLEDWTRWDHWQGRPGEPDGHRRETEVSCSLECHDLCLTFSFSGQVSSVIFYSSEFSIWIVIASNKAGWLFEIFDNPFTISPIKVVIASILCAMIVFFISIRKLEFVSIAVDWLKSWNNKIIKTQCGPKVL